MNRNLAIAAIGVFIAACTQEQADVSRAPVAKPDSSPAAESPAAQVDISGAEAYRMVCASCHETGLNGAPVTGDADAWSDRSTHWEAVLFNHAKNGYMEMPAKGGRPELSDRSVVAAAEYMLSITYPDRPPN